MNKFIKIQSEASLYCNYVFDIDFDGYVTLLESKDCEITGLTVGPTYGGLLSTMPFLRIQSQIAKKIRKYDFNIPDKDRDFWQCWKKILNLLAPIRANESLILTPIIKAAEIIKEMGNVLYCANA